MSSKIYTCILGTGSYIPTRRIANDTFLTNIFFNSDGSGIDKPTDEIINTFEKISGIKERRHVTNDLVTSDIACLAAQDALTSSGTDKESLDYLIVAHTCGDVAAGGKRMDILPSLASRVKQKLKIKNHRTVAYDITFGCPGWVQGMIQSDYFIRSGDAVRILVIGADVLSRVSDPHDRDSMLYADGAGATILEAKAADTPCGILSHASRSDTLEYAYMLRMGPSYNPDIDGDQLFVKMNGHKLYEYALKTVPKVVQQTLEKAGLTITDVNKVLIHQANAKMDRAILERVFSRYRIKEVPYEVMPMIIRHIGNSSVATVPTLLDLLYKGKIDDQEWEQGDIVVFTSVGAGMNINAFVYKVP